MERNLLMIDNLTLRVDQLEQSRNELDNSDLYKKYISEIDDLEDHCISDLDHKDSKECIRENKEIQKQLEKEIQLVSEQISELYLSLDLSTLLNEFNTSISAIMELFSQMKTAYNNMYAKNIQNEKQIQELELLLTQTTQTIKRNEQNSPNFKDVISEYKHLQETVSPHLEKISQQLSNKSSQNFVFDTTSNNIDQNTASTISSTMSIKRNPNVTIETNKEIGQEA
ncbi:hypothetical protein WA158_001114 [Blastocystis sp. Blastoise]